MRFRFSVSSLLLAVAVVGVCLALYADGQHDVCVRRTGRELDLAIVGRGYFKLLDPETNQLHYTRRGRFYLNAEGSLALGLRSDSPRLDPPIQIPPDYTKITVTPDGLLVVCCGRDYSPQQIGGIELTIFPDDAGLELVGDNRYVPSEEAAGVGMVGQPGGPDGAGVIQQFWLEENPSSDAMWIGKLLAVAGGAAAFAGVWWIKRRFERLEATVNRLAQSLGIEPADSNR
jgi:flagellar basal-body rod protein FlgG